MKIVLKICEEELDKNLGKEVLAVTYGNYPMHGILEHNDSIVYDECRYRIVDIEDSKKSYMFNVEDIKVINIKD